MTQVDLERPQEALDDQKWRKAMQEEYDSLLKNRTWPRATWFHGGGNTLLEYFFEGSLLEYYETSSDHHMMIQERA